MPTNTPNPASPQPLTQSKTGLQAGTGEARKRRLGFPNPRHSTGGWGVCLANLFRELSARLEIVFPESSSTVIPQFDGPVFTPLLDHDFNPYIRARGSHNFAYTFFESELERNAASNAARYDVVFCGSTWCLERMRDRGIDNGKVLIQGVDPNIFRPRIELERPATAGLRVFTGGKFEFRKGQDLVVAAFRKLLERHPHARLVCAWHNPWPQTIGTMNLSPHIARISGHFVNQVHFFRELLLRSGIPEVNFEVLPALDHAALANAMHSTDFGVFPNRCEGGTNLILMEYLVCGKPAVASVSTGHADVTAPEFVLPLPPHLTARHWDEPEVGEITDAMDQLSKDSALRIKLGLAAAEAMRPWTWERAAQTVMETIFPEGF